MLSHPAATSPQVAASAPAPPLTPPDLELVTDNATRWNSTFQMIRRALRVEERLRQFCRDERYRNDLQNDTLSDDDWEHLTQVAKALRPFYDATQRMQGAGREGHHGSIWEAIPALEGLLAAMESGLPPSSTRRHQKPTPLEVAHQNAWEKLRKYYKKTDICPEIYGAALLLHPCHRRTYFDLSWKGDLEA